jgi:hypothetical protein
MKGDSTGGKRQVADSRRQIDSARESGPSLDTLDSLVGCPPSVTPAMLDAAGETDWWWCPSCGVPIQPEHVTFEETHDPRCGGCGKPVWPESEVDHTPSAESEVL